MKPENIERYSELNREVERAQNALAEFEQSQAELIAGAEILPVAVRFDRIWALIGEHTVDSVNHGGVLIGKTETKLVTASTGQSYYLVIGISSLYNATRTISAIWTGSDNDNLRSEKMDNTWIHTDPTNETSQQVLADLEWTVEAFLNSPPREG